MPGFWENLGQVFTGTPGRQQSLINPQQEGVQQQLLSNIMQILNGQGGNNPMSQQLQHQFQTNVIPSLAERFTSLGSGSQNSSAFQGALGSAGANLQTQLGAQQQNQLSSLLGPALQQTQAYIPRQTGALEGIAGPLTQALLMWGGSGLSSGIGQGIDALKNYFGNSQNTQGQIGQGQPQGFQDFNRGSSFFDQFNRHSMFNNSSGGMFKPY